MTSIVRGNLNESSESNPELRGWFAGQFIKGETPLHNEDLELKWGIHKRGEVFDTVRANKKSKSLAILIEGKVKLVFPDDNEEVSLEKQGDFVFWNSGVFHRTEFLEDCKILTIRWPSLPDDVIKKQN